MWALLTAPGSLPFAVALAVMVGITVLEGAAVLFGGAAIVDTLLPDVEAGPSAEGGSGAVSRALAWLRIGKVPLPMLLVLFLGSFGLAGLAVQSAAADLLGGPLPAVVAALPAVALAVLATRHCGRLIGRLMPRDETDAVSMGSLVGRVGAVTIGTARRGHPAEARVRDGRGTTHYLMVEPLEADDTLPAGSQVLLVALDGAAFKAIRNPSPALADRA